MSVSDKDAFGERVNKAIAGIVAGRTDTRSFFALFEMSDGDALSVAVYRRSLKNARLAERIWKALCRVAVMNAVERLKDVPTRKLAEEARKQREGTSHLLDTPNPDPGAAPEERAAPQPARTTAGRDSPDDEPDHPLFALARLQPHAAPENPNPARP